MAIQSSINSLLSKIESVVKYQKGYQKVSEAVKAQEEQNKWFRDAAKILSTPTPEDETMPWSNRPSTLEKYVLGQKTKMAQSMARAEVENREDTINQSKRGFDDHIANLIREYGKGSERP